MAGKARRADRLLSPAARYSLTAFPLEALRRVAERARRPFAGLRDARRREAAGGRDHLQGGGGGMASEGRFSERPSSSGSAEAPARLAKRSWKAEALRAASRGADPGTLGQHCNHENQGRDLIGEVPSPELSHSSLDTASAVAGESPGGSVAVEGVGSALEGGSWGGGSLANWRLCRTQATRRSRCFSQIRLPS